MSRDGQERYLFDELVSYGSSDYYPFHMPGHKRRMPQRYLPEGEENSGCGKGSSGDRGSYAENDERACSGNSVYNAHKGTGIDIIDITEIAGFDNLHNPQGIIKEAEERTAGVFGADKCFYLVNGSSGGILASISAAAGRGTRIIAARNCHRCVYHAIGLLGLRAEYVLPMPAKSGIAGSIDPSDIKELLDRYDDVRAVVITSPTYDGVVSDIEAIAKVAHTCGVPLIVDEAHGAHFGFSRGFPPKAVSCGADYCIESVHKTLPAYTQSALLLAREDGYADIGRLKRQLRVFQSTSPSYILMSGIDSCTRILMENGTELFDKFEKRLDEFYRRAEKLRNLYVLPHITDDRAIFRRDHSKVLIGARCGQISGADLDRILRERYHLEMEMSSLLYVTALTSIMDTDEGFNRLISALEGIDADIEDGSPGAGRRYPGYQNIETGIKGRDLRKACPETFYAAPVINKIPDRAMDLAEAMDAGDKMVLLENAAGLISADVVCPYPPGIPLLAPGEIIDENTLKIIKDCLEAGIEVQGIENGSSIAVVDI